MTFGAVLPEKKQPSMLNIFLCLGGGELFLSVVGPTTYMAPRPEHAGCFYYHTYQTSIHTTHGHKASPSPPPPHTQSTHTRKAHAHAHAHTQSIHTHKAHTTHKANTHKAQSTKHKAHAHPLHTHKAHPHKSNTLHPPKHIFYESTALYATSIASTHDTAVV